MIVGLCMAKNEAGIIGRVVTHLYAQGVDTVVVEDGHSTDRTRMEALDAGATLVHEPSVEYDQPASVGRLAAEHCEPGDWVIPFDADEFWYSDHGTIAEVLARTDASKCWARMWLHKDWDHRAKDPKPMPKVAFRYQPGAQLAWGNHSVDVPGKDVWGVLDIREWQYRSLEHLKAKAKKRRQLVANTPNLGSVVGSHMAPLAAMNDAQLEAEWARLQTGEWVFDPIPCNT